MVDVAGHGDLAQDVTPHLDRVMHDLEALQLIGDMLAGADISDQIEGADHIGGELVAVEVENRRLEAAEQVDAVVADAGRLEQRSNGLARQVVKRRVGVATKEGVEPAQRVDGNVGIDLLGPEFQDPFAVGDDTAPAKLDQGIDHCRAVCHLGVPLT